MNRITYTTLALVLMLSCSHRNAAQESGAGASSLVVERGVTSHRKIDHIYRRFADAYDQLDARAVAALYTETAAYLTPGEAIRTGRDDIEANFAGFFDSVRRERGRLAIKFRIVQRRADKNLTYDVGIYTLRVFDDKGAVRSSSEGKFVVVAVRERGVWRFQVDGYNDLPKRAG